jgi:hypothetical protein
MANVEGGKYELDLSKIDIGAEGWTVIALDGASFDELEVKRVEAVERADFELLEVIRAIALGRDRNDDTDSRYYYLIVQCTEDIKNVMTYYG